MKDIRVLPVAHVKTVLPANFRFTLRQAAEKLGISYAILYANVYRDPKEQHFLRAHQDTPGGTIKVYAWDLEDYDQRRRLKTEESL
jgi:hypothetical protein